MKNISFWASRHIWPTRFIILFIYVVLHIIGLTTGDILYAEGIIINEAYVFLCVVVTIIAVLIYPTHNKKISSPKLYRLHKIADTLLAGTTFLFIVFTGNKLNNIIPVHHANGASVVSIVPQNTSSYDDPAQKQSGKVSKDNKKSKFSFRELHKKIKAALKEIRQAYRQDKNGERIALVVLASVVASILILLLAALSCQIACTGSEALAFVVFAVGITGIIFALVGILKRINKKYKKVDPPKEPSVIQG
jgi:hypothetical protein